MMIYYGSGREYAVAARISCRLEMLLHCTVMNLLLIMESSMYCKARIVGYYDRKAVISLQWPR